MWKYSCRGIYPTVLPPAFQAAGQQSKPHSVEMLCKASPQTDPLQHFHSSLSHLHRKTHPRSMEKKNCVKTLIFTLTFKQCSQNLLWGESPVVLTIRPPPHPFLPQLQPPGIPPQWNLENLWPGCTTKLDTELLTEHFTQHRGNCRSQDPQRKSGPIGGFWIQIPVPQNGPCDLGQALQHPCAPNTTVRGEQCPCTSTSKCYKDIRDPEVFRQDSMTYQEANSVATNQYYYWCQDVILFLIFVLEHYFEPQPGSILPRITHVSQSNYA